MYHPILIPGTLYHPDHTFNTIFPLTRFFVSYACCLPGLVACMRTNRL